MKIFTELLEGGSNSMQKRKKATLYVICATLALLAALLLLLLAVVVFSSIKNSSDKKQTPSESISIGNTETVTLSQADIHSGKLLLLNAENPLKSAPQVMLIATDRPKTEAGRPVYSVLGMANLSLEYDALKQFNLMAEQFYKNTKDDNLFVSTAYDASKSSQSPLYEAGNTVALGYYSTNEKGETLRNESIYNVDKFSWIYSNAHKYGFVLLTSEAQTDDNGKSLGSNVFRYVGAPHSVAMASKKLSFESYLEYLKTKTSVDSPLSVKASGKTYAIYYVAAAAEHKVPTEYAYTVSGNNTDGYIITVDLSKKLS